jgi:hypothetical protein
MSKAYFTNGGIAAEANQAPYAFGQQKLVQQDKDLVATGALIDFTDFTLGSENWGGYVKAGYVSERLICLQGAVESLADENSDPIALIPVGYKPVDCAQVAPTTNTTNPFVAISIDSTTGDYGAISSGTEAAEGDVINFCLFYVAASDQSPNDSAA